MTRFLLWFAGVVCAGQLSAQTISYTDADEWQAYDNFNRVFLDTRKYIYRDYSDRPNAVDRWGGAAAIWCQAIYYDMAVNAYRRALQENDATRMAKYRLLAQRIYNGEKTQYCNFDFDNCNTNTGWFVYDDIMWWTCALARAYELFGTSAYLAYSEKSFCRVWYGSKKVGDDGSYADPARFEGKYGGGMFWEWQPIDSPKPHQPGDFRSACINFPTVIAACTLYNLVPDGRTAPTTDYPTRQTREWYLEKAREVYDWAHSTLVSNGRVADGIHGGGPEWKDHLYNQATYIGASCLLYKITGEAKYLANARRAADYVFTSMSSGYILPLETGVEQGIYCAIFAQYLHMLVYDCGQTRYLTHVRRNIERGWTRRDTERGISNCNFNVTTKADERVESYTASGLPALMLLFPVGDSQTAVEPQPARDEAAASRPLYGIDGRLVRASALPSDVSSLPRGMYISGRHKMLVK